MISKQQDCEGVRTIAIWGPHGSSGKSTIAINLAESMCNSGFKVLLVDADLANPSLAIMLGLDGAIWSATRTADVAGLDASRSETLPNIWPVACGTRRFHLMTGIAGASRWGEVGIGELQQITQHLNQYDRIVYDLSSPVNSAATLSSISTDRNQLTRFLIGAVDQLIALGRPDFLGVQRLASLMLEIKKLRKDKPTRVVFNQIEPIPSVSAALDSFELLARDRISAGISRDVRTVLSALRNGQPARMTRRSAKFVSDIDALATLLLTP